MVAETKRWEYDTLGNRLAETDLQTGIGTSYQANSMNQYSYVDDELLKYDDNGNLEYDGDYYRKNGDSYELN